MDMKNYDDPQLKQILEKVVPEFAPQKVFLFGSRAKNSFHQNSDYDLFLVIPDSSMTKTERAQRAHELTWRLGYSIDFFIYTEQEFLEWKSEVNSVAHSAVTEGLELEIV